MCLIGIDVGGTFTDGIIYSNGNIVNTVKIPTNNIDLSESLLLVLDNLLNSIAKKDKLERIVISTTLVTNLLTTKQDDPVAVLMMHGYGLPNSYYVIGDNYYFVQGSIDFRGNEVEPIIPSQIQECIEDIKNKKIDRIVVAGKFSNRNNEHEVFIREMVKELYPEALVLISSEVANRLNFSRRTATAYYTALTYFEWNKFIDNVYKALKTRGINTDVHILKADGGTIPLDASRHYPCQTIYSGPAASTMGALALTMDNLNSVVIDIGGTTSDISLIIEGQPLYASKGAVIKQKFTHVDAFSLTSLPLGGDSRIDFKDGAVQVMSERQDFALCFGGKYLTVTDVFNDYFNLNIGDYKASNLGIRNFSKQVGIDDVLICKQVVEIVLDRLEKAIKKMFNEWEKEPAYKVWEVIHGRKFELHRIIGIGAASSAIIPILANRLGVSYFLHPYSPVANALGTAVARPTINVTIHADTQYGYYTAQPYGLYNTINNPTKFTLEDAKKLALQHLHEAMKQQRLIDYDEDISFYMEEQYNVVRGWDTVGKIFDVGVQIKPGFIKEYAGVF